ncbi:MAG TPA: hypothetical protein VH208_07140 [Myxococcaceae bacterium]|nr:hypothetical protein [Myxococcaceae bacterium]
MRLPGRLTVGIHLAGVAALAWLYGGDLIEYRRGSSAPVAAMTDLPNPYLALAACLAGAAALGVAAWGVFRSKPEGFRGYRLLPIVVVVVLFVDLFVLGASRGPNIPALDRFTAAMEHFAGDARQSSRHGAVFADAAKLEASLVALGPPPYLIHGARVPRYILSLREGCQGPVTASSGEALGTVFYCVSSARDRAWVSAVALPAEQRFGAPAIFSWAGTPRGWLVQAPELDGPTVELPGSGL